MRAKRGRREHASEVKNEDGKVAVAVQPQCNDESRTQADEAADAVRPHGTRSEGHTSPPKLHPRSSNKRGGGRNGPEDGIG